MEHTIEIPADAKTVTLELAGRRALTLRSLLPQVGSEVELVVEDVFAKDDGSAGRDFDRYRLKADNGDSLLRKLTRSRVVDGKSLLDLEPIVRLVNPVPTLINGTLVDLSGTGCIQLSVVQPASGKED